MSIVDNEGFKQLMTTKFARMGDCRHELVSCIDEHVLAAVRAERTRIARVIRERRNKIRTYAATGDRLKIRTEELEAIAKLIGVELEKASN